MNVVGALDAAVATTANAPVASAVPVPAANTRVFPGLEQWAAIGLIPLAGAGTLAWFLRKGDRGGFVTTTAVTVGWAMVSLSTFDSEYALSGRGGYSSSTGT